MQLTKSKWRNDPLKFFLFPLPGCPSSDFTRVRIKNRAVRKNPSWGGGADLKAKSDFFFLPVKSWDFKIRHN